MPHILVTNDDGVRSAGLLALARALRAAGDVSVIAPDSNRSAIGRGITIHNPLHVEEVALADGTMALATDGTPVDCVRFAALGLVDRRPDLIVSGINLGLNLGDDVTYSGTVAAALEATLLGIPGIAVSAQAVDPAADQWDGAAYDFRAAAAFAARVAPRLLAGDLPEGLVLNVNVPPGAPEAITGARVTRLGRRVYNDELTLLDERDGRRRYTIYGGMATHEAEEGSDFDAIADGAISVTPLHFNLTDVGRMDAVEALQLAGLLDVGAPRSA